MGRREGQANESERARESEGERARESQYMRDERVQGV